MVFCTFEMYPYIFFGPTCLEASWSNDHFKKFWKSWVAGSDAVTSSSKCAPPQQLEFLKEFLNSEDLL